jgi:uncharacterized membrane protein YgdD (TMEM256/DUF423 family)
MTQLFIFSGSTAALAGVIARSLSSHAIRPFLEQRGKLENFNLAADYLLLHGIALIGVAILCQLFPEARYQRAGWAFIIGSILFQGSVLLKSCVSIQPFGFLTPLGGAVLMAGWLLICLSSLQKVQ